MLYRNLSLISVGSTEDRENFIHPEKSAPLYELIAVKRGVLHICEDYSRYSVSEGELLLLDKNKSYYGYTESEGPVSFMWLYFDGEPDSPSEVKLLDCGDAFETVTGYIGRIAELFTSYECDEQTVSLMMQLLFAEVNRIFLFTQNRDTNVPISEICRWIYENCDKNIKAIDVARRFSYNEDYLTRLFKNHYGMGVKNCIDKIKMQYIKKLLCDPGIALKDIPAACGFGNYRSFLMFFSYHEDMTPTQFRKMNFV